MRPPDGNPKSTAPPSQPPLPPPSNPLTYEEAIRSNEWDTYGRCKTSGVYTSVPESVDRLMYTLFSEGSISADRKLPSHIMTQLVDAMVAADDHRPITTVKAMLNRAVSKSVRSRVKITGGLMSRDSSERAKKRVKASTPDSNVHSDSSDCEERVPSQCF